MRGFPSRFEVKVVLNSIARVYTNPAHKETCLALLNKYMKRYWINTWKYLNKPFRLETTLPPDVSNSIARVYTDQRMRTHVLFFWENTKNNITIQNTSKNLVGSRLETTFQPSFLFLFMICYHCVLFVFRSNNKYWKNTGKYPEHFLARNHPPGFLFGSYSWFVIIACASCSSKTYWKIPEDTGNI